MSIEEEWRPVVGWESFYEVSDLGRVRSKSRVVVRQTNGATYTIGKVLATQLSCGWSVITLGSAAGISGRNRRIRVAYLVAEAFTDWDLMASTIGFLNGDCRDARLINLCNRPVSEADESWLPCPGWEEQYEVSSLGRVRSMARYVAFRGKAGPTERLIRPRLLKPKPNSSGYPQVALRRNGYGGSFVVHRLVCPAFHGPRPKYHVIRHLDGNPLNNRADNLAYGTRRQNEQDKFVHAFAKLAGMTVEKAMALAGLPSTNPVLPE